MGAGTLRRLLAEALKLPEAERAELAHALVESLDAPVDVDVAEEWASEVRRRLTEIDAGTATLIDRDEFRRRLQARFGDR